MKTEALMSDDVDWSAR